MTHIERMEELFRLIGLEFSKMEDKQCHVGHYYVHSTMREYRHCWIITIGQGNGYNGFYTDFIFDFDTGEFLGHGVYE